jgi:hypothetical protein
MFRDPAGGAPHPRTAPGKREVTPGPQRALQRLAALWRGVPRVTDARGLQTFLDRQAAFLAQKTVVEYCRARSGLNWQALFNDSSFQAALEESRWSAYVAVLQDMLLVAEGYLRPYVAAQPPVLTWWLEAALRSILDSHRTDAPAGHVAAWPEATATFSRRLARAQLGEPHDPAQIAEAAGAIVFDTLPIHSRLRSPDREMVVNAIRFGMLAFFDRLREAANEPARLAEQLTAQHGRAE